MLKVYEEPLTAALNSNRAILSYANIQTVLSPVSRILELHRYVRTHLYGTAFVCGRHGQCLFVCVAGCFGQIWRRGCSSGGRSSASEMCLWNCAPNSESTATTSTTTPRPSAPSTRYAENTVLICCTLDRIRGTCTWVFTAFYYVTNPLDYIFAFTYCSVLEQSHSFWPYTAQILI